MRPCPEEGNYNTVRIGYMVDSQLVAPTGALYNNNTRKSGLLAYEVRFHWTKP